MLIETDFWDNFSKQNNLISAHRGYRSIRAENTMSAFEASLEKSDFIELDVGFTKDGVAIIIHDDTLDRTSNVKKSKGFKKPYNVVDYTFDEIKKLDFSSWFIKKDPFKTIEKKSVNLKELEKLEIQRILTLEEVLVFIKKNNMPVNIEIKDMRDTPFDKVATQKVVDIVKKLEVEHLVLFSSFNHIYIKELSIIAPNITRAALQEKKHPNDIVKYLKDLNVHGYHCEVDIFDEIILKELQKNNFFVNVYTVNKDDDKKRLFNLGVKAIFTDFL